MAKKKKDVVEETTKQEVEQPKEEVVKQKIDESKFESAGDDGVIKVDLSKPPQQNSEAVEKEPTKEEVAVVNEEPKEKKRLLKNQKKMHLL